MNYIDFLHAPFPTSWTLDKKTVSSVQNTFSKISSTAQELCKDIIFSIPLVFPNVAWAKNVRGVPTVLLQRSLASHVIDTVVTRKHPKGFLSFTSDPIFSKLSYAAGCLTLAQYYGLLYLAIRLYGFQ